MDRHKAGYCSVALAYLSWGLLPAYWKLLVDVRPEVLLFHRALWSAATLALVLSLRGRSPFAAVAAACRPRALAVLAACAMLLSTNWLTYAQAIERRELVAASLGYLLCPILTIVLGALFLGEPLNRMHRLGIVFMTVGVLIRGALMGQPPWIALLLACSFSAYTLLKKMSGAAAAEGLFVETLVMLVPATFLYAVGDAPSLWPEDGRTALALAGAGPITAVPLLLLVFGAKSVSLRFVGVMQYVTPSLILLSAVLLYGEPFTRVDATTFPLIWIGALMFVANNLFRTDVAKALTPRSLPLRTEAA